MRSLLAIFIGLIIGASCFAQQADSTGKQFTLSRPVPRAQMRDMQTDRPDVTESAYSVDAGHFQCETDLFKLTRNKQDGLLTEQRLYNAANFKIGLSNTTDFQVVIENYVENLEKPAGGNQRTVSSGLGDITLRFKKNLFGNYRGKAALAVMPYVKIPTSAESKNAEYGVILPFALALSENWSFGAQMAGNLAKNDENVYQTELLNSATAGRSLGEKFSAFVEYYFTYGLNDKQFQLYGDAGMVFSLSDNVKFDAGINYGLTKHSDKVYFAGFSFRY